MTVRVKIKQGLDLPLEGRPSLSQTDLPVPSELCFTTADFEFARPTTPVSQGQTIQPGDVLFYDRKNEALKVLSPVAGKVRDVVWGTRRTLDRLVISEIDTPPRHAGSLQRYSEEQVLRLRPEEVIAHMSRTGSLALVVQRPFVVRANPDVRPKSIFVNAMQTAPFHPDVSVVVAGRERFFQTGLHALSRIAPIFLCLDGRRADLPTSVTHAAGAEVCYFEGPHPAGNSSVHIHYIDPIRQGDVVWTLTAEGVVQVGHAFLEGTLPLTRIISVGGPAIAEPHRQHYEVCWGTPVSQIVSGRTKEGEVRLIAGDALYGRIVQPADPLRLRDDALTALFEGRKRRYLGWAMPGWDQFSASRTFLSSWLRRKKLWALDTNMHGSRRPMVLTGLYDRYVPLHIMSDFLIRAILANDYEEAIHLGLLEVAPEDFALPAFVCPSKMDLVQIIQHGLQAARREVE